MIIATICVRDEEEIVGSCIEHHLLHGVDKIIITDNGSVDSTNEIIRSYSDVIVVEKPIHDYRHGEWVTEMARKAYYLGATWVMNIDSDEFWYNFKLAYEAPNDVDVITIKPNYDYTPLLYAKQDKFNSSEMPFFTHCPSVLRMVHRAMPNVVVADGNHYLKNNHRRNIHDSRIYLKHYSIRSYDQFEKKIINGGTALEKSPQNEGQSTHWRMWYKQWKNGELHEEYKKISMSPDQVIENYYKSIIYAKVLL